MKKHYLMLVTFLATILCCIPSWAVNEVELFPKGELNLLAPAEQTFHPKFVDEGDYSESWFTMAQAADGGVLMALMSVTNIGPRTFDSSIDVQYYAADGSSFNWHQEYRRKDIKAAADHLDVKIGPNQTKAIEGGYHLSFKRDQYSLELDITNVMPPFQQEGGRVLFHADRQREWDMSILVPHGKTAGTFKVSGKSYNLNGNGYFDHSIATLKIPSMARSWWTLRLYHPELDAVVHLINLEKKYQNGQIKLGVIGRNGQQLGASTLLDWTVVGSRKEPLSGKMMANKFKLNFTAGGYKVEGTVEEDKFLESIDALGQLNAFTRGLIKAFYAKPFMMRWWARCNLKVTDPNGQVSTIVAPAMMETNYY